MKFFERLYKGFEAEYFVVGRLFAAGLEAFKLPADFGFDLIVGNIRQRTFDAEPESESPRFPHVIQVKSRKVLSDYFSEGSSGRPQADVCFTLSVKDWDLLVEEERASLVSVLLRQHPAMNQSTHTALWLPGPQLRDLESRGYFRRNSSKDEIRYSIRLRLEPRHERDELLRRLVVDGHLTEIGEDKLKRMLPPLLPRNWMAKSYLSLLRSDRSGSPRYVARLLPSELTDLGAIGRTVDLTVLD